MRGVAADGNRIPTRIWRSPRKKQNRNGWHVPQCLANGFEKESQRFASFRRKRRGHSKRKTMAVAQQRSLQLRRGSLNDNVFARTKRGPASKAAPFRQQSVRIELKWAQENDAIESNEHRKLPTHQHELSQTRKTTIKQMNSIRSQGLDSMAFGYFDRNQKEKKKKKPPQHLRPAGHRSNCGRSDHRPPSCSIKCQVSKETVVKIFLLS